MNKIIERLKREFHDEDYRYAYDEEFSNSRMAMQIKVIREQRGMTQKELAELAEMRQSRISELENANYSMWSVSTLRRLSKALGIRLFFGFEGWGELLPEVETFNRASLQKPSFEEDGVFQKENRPRRTRRKHPPLIKETQPGQQGFRFIGLVPQGNNPMPQSVVRNELFDASVNTGKPKDKRLFQQVILSSQTSTSQKEEAA